MNAIMQGELWERLDTKYFQVCAQSEMHYKSGDTKNNGFLHPPGGKYVRPGDYEFRTEGKTYKIRVNDGGVDSISFKSSE